MNRYLNIQHIDDLVAVEIVQRRRYPEHFIDDALSIGYTRPIRIDVAGAEDWAGEVAVTFAAAPPDTVAPINAGPCQRWAR